MSITGTYCSKLFSTYETEASSKQALPSLVAEIITSFPFPSLQSTDAKEVVTSILQKAGGVDHTLTMPTMLAPMHNTPPQIAAFLYINSKTFLSRQHLFPNFSISESSRCFPPLYHGIWDVQMYSRSVDLLRENSDQRSWIARLVGFILGNGQQDDKKKPKPDKKKPEPKPEKKKPGPRKDGGREPREPREPNALGNVRLNYCPTYVSAKSRTLLACV